MKTRLAIGAAAARPVRRRGPRGSTAWMVVFLVATAPVRGLLAQRPLVARETATIVLPPRLMAGHPATLAVVDGDGRLAPGAKVELGEGETVTTDRTGRAVFQVPAAGAYLRAEGSGAVAVALIDPAVGESEPNRISLPPTASLHDRFWICGAGLRGNAEEDSVKLNGETALVLASSPVCLAVLPGPSAQPGLTTVSVEAPGVEWNATTTLVSLEFVPPHPALNPGQQGELVIRARGSSEKLGIVVQNRTPEVLRFVRGDIQELVTGGGPENSAIVRIQAISSGDFSLSARLLAAPDAAAAERYLQAAVPLAPKDSQHRVRELARRLLQHRPQDVAALRAQIARMAETTMPGDFRTLLEAAEAEL